MYLVEPSAFKEFLDKNDLQYQDVSKPVTVPCIIEFNRGDILKAKVETLSYAEFVSVVKFGKTITAPKNKYWIRGKEWDLDGDGNPIMELNI
jgi:hypothetical protein